MRRAPRPPTLALVPSDAEPTFEQWQGHRNEIVELPWPDRFGRIVLLSIDGNGRIFDQAAAEGEHEANALTYRMTLALEKSAHSLALLS